MISTTNESLGLGSSVYRSIIDSAHKRPITDTKIRGFSADMEAAWRKHSPETAADRGVYDFFLPLAMLNEWQRALGTNVFTSGGSFVGEDVGAASTALRPLSVCLKAGASLLTDLKGNITFPAESTSVNFAFYGQLDAITEQDSTFGNIT